MNYNFDEMIDRTNTNCAKYDEMNRKFGSNILHLAVADMDFRSPQPIINALAQRVAHGVFGYTNLPDNYGALVKGWMRRKYQCDIQEDWTIFSPRINMAANMAVETLTSPGDRIILQTPAYPALTNAIVKYNRKILESPLELANGEFRMNLEALEAQMDSSVKMFILCNPHNPTGRVWSRQELIMLSDFCEKHNLIVLSDDIHADMVFSSSTYTPILNISQEITERTVLFTSITKTFNVPGIILSNMIIPNQNIREKMKRTVDRWGLHNPNSFASAILEPAYTLCDDWLKDVNNYIESNHRFLYDYINANFPLFDVYGSQGTYLAWIGYKKTGLTEEQMEKFFLRKAKVSVYMGSHFGKCGKGFFRINFATSRSYLESALERIKQAYSEINKV